MKSAPLPENEAERLQTLLQLDILDTLEEQCYDDLTLLAAQICGTPIALVSLIDKDRQWFKSHYGLAARETQRDYAFCAHAILEEGPFVVMDADKDERFSDNPLVTGDPLVKFYSGMPLVLENSMPVGTLCVIDHIPRELSESQLTALEALSRQVVSNLELRLKVRQLQELDSIKNSIISLISHELRTPVTSIKGSLQLLLCGGDCSLTTEAASLVEIAARNSDRLLAVVNDILDISKIDEGKLDLNIQQHSLPEIVEEAVELNQSFVEKCNCQTQLNKPTDSKSLDISVDKGRLIQVMTNLISNAAKFTSTGDTIVVAIDSIDGERAKVSIIDHGQGISLADQPSIFKRFPGCSSTNEKIPGTGLGLNLCKSLIEAMGGEIGFVSTPGRGSDFYFTFPC
ncbi:GAF domain-containing sensor histidine kinase [Endozoicomonas atrinae]|uniref:GAF domain-containing sensor histidine kinase n=1 Tax=Endozoicomonas atrinae TaxID=1333660 RepID=UPI003AFFB3FF